MGEWSEETPRYTICGQIPYIMKTSESFEGKYDQRVGQSIKGIGFYVGCHNFGNMNCNRAGRPVQPDSWSPSDFLGTLKQYNQDKTWLKERFLKFLKLWIVTHP